MNNKILTTIFCLSSLVCGTAEAKKKMEQAKDGPFTEINFSTIKSPNQNRLTSKTLCLTEYH